MASSHHRNNFWLAVFFLLPMLTPLIIKARRVDSSSFPRKEPESLVQFFLQGPKRAVSPPADPYEPNDDFTQATFLATNASSKYGYLWPLGDEDWFWFQVPEAGAHRIETWLDSVPAGGEYRLSIYHPGGALIAETEGAENVGGSLSLSVGEGGRYRARVWSRQGGDAWDSYRIRTHLSPIPSADLALSMRMRTIPLPYPVTIYQFFVWNLGPDPSTGIILIDTLPPGVVFGGVSGSGGWACDHQEGQVFCRHPGPLDSGESLSPVTLRLYSLNNWGQEVPNTAWVRSAVFDPEESNNRIP
jgi:uncharacterized repeat protein (TIGR01451 family)